MSNVELSESLEDYLLAIAALGREDDSRSGQVHSGRVAERVGVSTASVTHAFRALSERGLIEYRRYQAVRLTELGSEVAHQVLSRKQTLLRFFREILGLDQQEAEQNAHRMEHVITSEAVRRLEQLVERLDRDESVNRETPGPTGR